MDYASTIHIKQGDDGYYYVHAGWCGTVVGEKNNYFPTYKQMESREVKAHAFLGKNIFPKTPNKHEAMAEAILWAEQYKNYVKRVVDMPSALKVGHSCAHWR